MKCSRLWKHRKTRFPRKAAVGASRSAGPSPASWAWKGRTMALKEAARQANGQRELSRAENGSGNEGIFSSGAGTPVSVGGPVVRRSPGAWLSSCGRCPSADGALPQRPEQQHGEGRAEARWSRESKRTPGGLREFTTRPREICPRVQDDLQGSPLDFISVTAGRILERSLSRANSLITASVSLIFQEHSTMNMSSILYGGALSGRGQTSCITHVACTLSGEK